MAETQTTILTAAWVAPMSSPIIRDGAIAMRDGRIAGVGTARDLRSAHPDAQVIDTGSSILLPGLVNAHTHLELSACACGDSPGGDFAGWILAMGPRLEAVAPGDRQRAFEIGAQRGIEQCLKFGVTTVGDISQQYHITRPILAASRLRCVSYGEVLGLAARQERFEELLPGAIDEQWATDRLRIGLSPHAPYTVDRSGYERCLAIARQRGMPLATHLAETVDETTFLASHGGQFRHLWDVLGFWRDGVVTMPAPPVRGAAELGLLNYPTLLAHVNYCDDEALSLLAAGRASVVYCPRTHRYFGHPPHRWRQMQAAGINVAVGTDSCASSPDLNLVDDLRLMHELAPDVDAGELLQMATTSAARAIGWADEIGDLSTGKWADVVQFAVETPDPLREILERDVLPERVWIGGRE